MKKQVKTINQDSVRVIKISKEALFEFIYENFINDQDVFLDADSSEISSVFDIDWENGQFIFCGYKSEDSNGNFVKLPNEIDLMKLMKNIPDTTDTMFAENRYRDYAKDELIELSKE